MTSPSETDSIIAVFIGVNYRSPAESVAYCRALRSLPGSARIDIVIADNSACFADPANADALKALRQLDVAVYIANENLGYFPGAAAALKWYRTGKSLPLAVIVSNIDLTVASRDFVARIGACRWPDGTMAIAPSIRRSAGEGASREDQNPMRLSPLSRRQFRRLQFIMSSDVIYGLYEIAAYLKSRFAKRRFASDPAPIYMAHGSFTIFTRRYFEKTAGLAFPGFLYCEEIFVAEEIRRAGGVVWYDPAFEIIHEGGQTTSALGWMRRRSFVNRSLKILAPRYFSADR